jgi:hypothetical protein
MGRLDSTAVQPPDLKDADARQVVRVPLPDGVVQTRGEYPLLPVHVPHRDAAVQVEFESKGLKPGFPLGRLKGWVTRRLSAVGQGESTCTGPPTANAITGPSS